jgi:hypothetical protein
MRPSDSPISSSSKVIEFIAKYPPDRVPICSRSLFREYLKKVANNPLDRMMWIVFDYGHHIMQLVREDHIAFTYGLLVSEDTGDVKKAEEAMQRTVGTYRIR